MITWLAPSIVVSSSGLETACFTASMALSSPFAFFDTDVCDALVDHNGLNICKVQIDKAWNIDQVCNSLNCLLKHLICLLKSIRHGGPAVNDLQKTGHWG